MERLKIFTSGTGDVPDDILSFFNHELSRAKYYLHDELSECFRHMPFVACGVSVNKKFGMKLIMSQQVCPPYGAIEITLRQMEIILKCVVFFDTFASIDSRMVAESLAGIWWRQRYRPIDEVGPNAKTDVTFDGTKYSRPGTSKALDDYRHDAAEEHGRIQWPPCLSDTDLVDCNRDVQALLTNDPGYFVANEFTPLKLEAACCRFFDSPNVGRLLTDAIMKLRSLFVVEINKFSFNRDYRAFYITVHPTPLEVAQYSYLRERLNR